MYGPQQRKAEPRMAQSCEVNVSYADGWHQRVVVFGAPFGITRTTVHIMLLPDANPACPDAAVDKVILPSCTNVVNGWARSRRAC